MPVLPVLSTISTLCLAPASGSVDTLQALWERGIPFSEFLAQAKARRETWHAHYAVGRLDPEASQRLQSLSGRWRLLVVAEDSCGDSANTIPFVATLVDSAGERLTMRVVTSKLGRAVMEAHRTRDGRAATPTIVLLDEQGQEAGCWVERPSPLARWVEAEGSKLPDQVFLDRKYTWYREDQGRTTISEILAMIEQAGPGRPCGGGA